MAGGARRAAPAVLSAVGLSAAATAFGPDLLSLVAAVGLFLAVVAAGCLPLLEVPSVLGAIDDRPTPRLDVNLLTVASVGVFAHAVTAAVTFLGLEQVWSPARLGGDPIVVVAIGSFPVGLWLGCAVGLPAVGLWDPTRVPGDGRLVLAGALTWYLLVLAVAAVVVAAVAFAVVP